MKETQTAVFLLGVMLSALAVPISIGLSSSNHATAGERQRAQARHYRGEAGPLRCARCQAGKYVFSIDPGLRNFITAINPKTGAKSIDPAFLPDKRETITVCPSQAPRIASRNFVTRCVINAVTRAWSIPASDLHFTSSTRGRLPGAKRREECRIR